MTDSSKTFILEEAKTPMEAMIIKGLLDQAGIEAKILGDELTDEFAASQALMNLNAVKIEVAADDAERARAIISDARAAGRIMEKQGDAGND